MKYTSVFCASGILKVIVPQKKNKEKYSVILKI